MIDIDDVKIGTFNSSEIKGLPYNIETTPVNIYWLDEHIQQCEIYQWIDNEVVLKVYRRFMHDINSFSEWYEVI